jgi:hypothetical protein
VNSSILSETTIRACSGHLTAEVQGETVVLQLTSGQYFGLNQVGTRVWNLIQSPTTLADLLDELLLDYDITRDELELDVIHLVEEMQSAQLAEICDNA